MVCHCLVVSIRTSLRMPCWELDYCSIACQRTPVCLSSVLFLQEMLRGFCLTRVKMLLSQLTMRIITKWITFISKCWSFWGTASNLTTTQSSSNALTLSWSASIPLQYSYTTLSQCGWPTLTVPVLVPSQGGIPGGTTITISRDNITTSAGSFRLWSVLCGVSLLEQSCW